MVNFIRLVDTLFKENISFFVDDNLIESMSKCDDYPVLIDDDGREHIIKSAELSDTMVNVDSISITTDKGDTTLTTILHYVIKFNNDGCNLLPILNDWLINMYRTMNKRGQDLLFSDFDKIIIVKDDKVECIIDEDNKVQPFYVTSIEADEKGFLRAIEGYSESGDFIRDNVLFDSVEVNAPIIYTDTNQEEITKIKELLDSGCLIVGKRESEYTGYMYSSQIMLDYEGKVIYSRHHYDSLVNVDLRFVDEVVIAFGEIILTIDDDTFVFDCYQKKDI